MVARGEGLGDRTAMITNATGVPGDRTAMITNATGVPGERTAMMTNATGVPGDRKPDDRKGHPYISPTSVYRVIARVTPTFLPN